MLVRCIENKAAYWSFLSNCVLCDRSKTVWSGFKITTHTAALKIVRVQTKFPPDG